MSEKVMSAHQPNFLPYLGFFDKMAKSDVFVIRDEVQFVERDYHNRNRIRIDGRDGNGEPQFKWLRVPVKKEQKDIKDIIIKNEVKDKNVLWNIFMLRQIRSNYETAPFFKQYFPELEAILLSKKEKLINLNMEIIYWLKKCFEIETEVVYASKLNGYEKTYDVSSDLTKITKAVQSDIYLSGPGGYKYLNMRPFEIESVKVIFQDFEHPTYQQRYSGFTPNLAAIDALFNIGNHIFNNVKKVNSFFVKK